MMPSVCSEHIAVTAAAMRAADRAAIDTLGIPGRVLMETAGRSAAAILIDRWGPPEGLQVSICCGKGNNGGDGLVMARVLHEAGCRVAVLALGDPDSRSHDAQANYEVLQRSEFPSDHVYETAPPQFWRADVIVDALLGTGLQSAPRGLISDAVHAINESPAAVLAVDIPTGLQTDTGEVLGKAIRAEITVCMGAPKVGLFVGEGPDCAGTIVTSDIGIPSRLIQQASREPGCSVLTNDRWVKDILPRLGRTAHKYTSGPALIVGGSKRYPGAPALAALAAARSGCGYVQVAVPDMIVPALATQMIESPPLGLASTADGHIAAGRRDPDLARLLTRARAVLLGPGLGRSADTTRFVRDLLAEVKAPLVIDADGLNALSELGITGLHGPSGTPWVLTPHVREFERLGGEVDGGPSVIERAKEFAHARGVVLVLKGVPTVIASPDGRSAVVGDPTPALGTAGSGDVLAGLVAGFLAQGAAPFEAAVAGAHLGTAAAQRYCRYAAAQSMTASDLIRHIGPVILERFS